MPITVHELIVDKLPKTTAYPVLVESKNRDGLIVLMHGPMNHGKECHGTVLREDKNGVHYYGEFNKFWDIKQFKQYRGKLVVHND